MIILILMLININVGFDMYVDNEYKFINLVKNKYNDIKQCDNIICYIENGVMLIFTIIVGLSAGILYLFVKLTSLYLSSALNSSIKY